MFRRTYSPFPAWPVPTLATGMFLIPRVSIIWPAAILLSGYVVGPALARLLQPARAIDAGLAEFPDCDDTTTEGETP